ncbi:MAG: putative lipid II flippase FtsW [Proteobacteria bacterium]|nr:putative lipid II flippase FtsW [Pseudomonadota bacterium]MBU2228283.1 putative lipid II flippase FtsW [Pseudomonadota bacterium]MBU2262914.1 putative lipid II flippase FtsW [Pseudomonadota bacterium]
MNRLSRGKKPDMILLLVTLLLAAIGTVMIYSSSSILATERFRDGQFFLKKQLVFLSLGLLVMFMATRFPYYKLRKLAWPGIAAAVILLGALWIPSLGIRAGGAVRWLNLGVVSFQVSELVKVALILFLAHFLTEKVNHIREIRHGLLIPLGVTGVMVGLILLQPDFGTTVILALITLMMLYMAGVRILHLAGIAAMFIPVAFWLLLHKSYRLARLTAFLDPWKDPRHSGFQIIQSLISFGSGGPFGVGIGDGMQKLFYLPEPHTDFILAVIAEEAGLIGVGLILLLYFILILRGFQISLKAPDLFGNLLAAGLTMMLALEAFINIAGVMGLIPLKGLALPFLSYGGTSLIMSLIAVGILLNISSYEG